jgi:hypothetical protein
MALWQVNQTNSDLIPDYVLNTGLGKATNGDRDFVIWHRENKTDPFKPYAFIHFSEPIADHRILTDPDKVECIIDWRSAGWIGDGSDQRLAVFVGTVKS